jgi:hypothetical protein
MNFVTASHKIALHYEVGLCDSTPFNASRETDSLSHLWEISLLALSIRSLIESSLACLGIPLYHLYLFEPGAQMPQFVSYSTMSPITIEPRILTFS